MARGEFNIRKDLQDFIYKSISTINRKFSLNHR